jgi:hypothetical protein
VSAPAAGRAAIRGRIVTMDGAGTVSPDELHDRLSYNCPQLWHVPRAFTNQAQWSANLPDYLAPGLATADTRTSGAARSG